MERFSHPIVLYSLTTLGEVGVRRFIDIKNSKKYKTTSSAYYKVANTSFSDFLGVLINFLRKFHCSLVNT